MTVLMFSPPVVVPLLISNGPTKPANQEFMKRTMEELATVRREGLFYKNKDLKVSTEMLNAF